MHYLWRLPRSAAPLSIKHLTSSASLWWAWVINCCTMLSLSVYLTLDKNKHYQAAQVPVEFIYCPVLCTSRTDSSIWLSRSLIFCSSSSMLFRTWILSSSICVTSCFSCTLSKACSDIRDVYKCLALLETSNKKKNTHKQINTNTYCTFKHT